MSGNTPLPFDDNSEKLNDRLREAVDGVPFEDDARSRDQLVYYTVDAKTKELVFVHGPFDYRILFQSYERGNLICRVRLLYNTELIDTARVDFSSPRSRSAFVNSAVKNNHEFDVAIVRRDLVNLEDMIVDKYAEIRAMTSESTTETPHVITAEEAAVAETLLKRYDLIEVIADAIPRLGIVNEQYNSMLIYLAYTSRLLDRPVHVIAKGESSTGKSFVTSTILHKLFPKESYFCFTDITRQALYYLRDTSMKHKILVIAELGGNEKAEYPIRIMQSEGSLSILTTQKNADDQLESGNIVVEGPVQTTLTTTMAKINDENETRQLTLTSDDSQEQNRDVIEQLSKNYARVADLMQDDELLVFQNAQRLLKPYEVVVPDAMQMFQHFPIVENRVRRDYEKFLGLICAVTLLYQYQREVIEIKGKPYLAASVDDYHIARIVGSKILESTIGSIPPKSMQIYEYCSDHRYEDVDERFEKADQFDFGDGVAKVEEDRKNHEFIYDELAAGLGWKSRTVSKWAGPLFEIGCLEFISTYTGGRGSRRTTFVFTGKLPLQLKLPERLNGTPPKWSPPESWTRWKIVAGDVSRI